MYCCRCSVGTNSTYLILASTYTLFIRYCCECSVRTKQGASGAVSVMSVLLEQYSTSDTVGVLLEQFMLCTATDVLLEQSISDTGQYVHPIYQVLLWVFC